jgi:hypothetical protein
VPWLVIAGWRWGDGLLTGSPGVAVNPPDARVRSFSPTLIIRRGSNQRLTPIRPQLREYLAWYEEVLGRIESGTIVAPGEQERLTEEASAVAQLLDLLDSSADEPAS